MSNIAAGNGTSVTSRVSAALEYQSQLTDLEWLFGHYTSSNAETTFD
ncbi:MAG TPA: hypothetical protein VMZ24_01710 [Patescibacteria group bacterium]|nr:hypothetical protein [Patescibacteria group bacterium]